MDYWGSECEAATHDSDRFRTVVYQDSVPTGANSCRTSRPAAGEKIQHPIAGVRVNADYAVQDSYRLLCRVSRLFLAVWTYDCLPPYIGRCLPLRRLFRAHESGRHVWDTVDIVVTIGIAVWVLSVPEYVVMLGGPALL